jgi:hypothetical protein
MRVPTWLTIGIALVVCGFGLYRIRLAFRPDKAADEDQGRTRRGFYAMGKRTHFLIGVIYLLLGGALIATSYGWNPFSTMFGPRTEAPTKDTAPTKGGVPVDQLPRKP